MFLTGPTNPRIMPVGFDFIDLPKHGYSPDVECDFIANFDVHSFSNVLSVRATIHCPYLVFLSYFPTIRGGRPYPDVHCTSSNTISPYKQFGGFGSGKTLYKTLTVAGDISL